MPKTITMRADENADDCFEDAVERYVARHPEAAGYDFAPRWADNARERVELDVPYSDEMRLEDAARAIEDAGYSVDERVACLIVAVADDGGDDPDADAALDEIRALVRPFGCTADWTGDGNTDSDGYSTSDIWVEVMS